jgi:hypothetical protein
MTPQRVLEHQSSTHMDGANTKGLNLVLKFKLAGDSELHVKGARRIKVDGHGGLVFQNAETGSVETINLQELRSFCIRPVNGSGWLSPLPVSW